MDQESMLKIFNKYGFYSFNKEPFLYATKEELGVIYTYKDDFYGQLTRKFIPNTLEELERFLSKYCWFKKNGQKYKVTIRLNSYEQQDPEVIFEKDGKKQSLENLKDLTKTIVPKKNTLTEKEKKYVQKLKRTVTILIQVVEEKITVQNLTYTNLVKITNEFIKNKNELNKKITELTKQKFKELKNIEEDKNEISYKDEIESWKEEIEKINDIETIKQFIQGIVEFIKTLEIEEGLLKNKYELIKLPLEIDLMKKQRKIVEEYLKKKTIFSKKEKLMELLKEVEEKSTLKEIVTFKHYKENEEKRIEEKYAIIPDLDIRTIGDYFIEFDNLKIKEPQLEETKKEEKEISYEQNMTFLEQKFNERPKKEQDYLIAMNYIIKNVWEEKEELLKKKIKFFLTLLENPNNIMIKIKYFKNIKTTNEKECIDSIKKELANLNTIKKDRLLNDINVFFKGSKIDEKRGFIIASTKRLLAPLQYNSKNDITYIAKLKKDASILFIPEEIIVDITQDDTLVLSKEKPFFFINNIENIFLEETSIIKVSDLEIEKQTKDKTTCVTNILCQKINQYQHIVIKRKEIKK